MTGNNGLLDGVRVIDLTRVLAGPYATMILGDLGADVIKVEAPGRGDDTRHWGPPFTESGQAGYFLSANRNKRSLTLNLKSESGMEVLKDLIREGDIVIDNFKAGTLERLGLSYQQMVEIKPDIIYCTITGYGYSGPYKDKPGYDFMAQALGGLMSVTGPASGEPYRVGVAITDLMTGMFASNAVIAALYAKERTGKGQRIDTALLDTQVAMMSYVATNYLISGEEPNRYGNGHPNIVPYQSFKAKDEFFAIAAGNDGQWAKLCKGAGKPDWIEDERYATNAKRVENRDILVPLLEELFSTKTAAEWISLCEGIGIPAAPINSIGGVLEDPQVIARERIIQAEHPQGGSVPMIASAMNILTNPIEIRYAPPLLGEHNREILAEVLGYDDTKVKALEQDGLI